MGLLDKILGFMKKPAPDNNLLKEAEIRDIHFVEDSPAYQANKKIEEAAQAEQAEILNKSFYRPYARDNQDAYTDPSTDTYRTMDGQGEDVDIDTGRGTIRADRKAAESHNGREDVGEVRDDLSARDDAQFSNAGGDGLRDNSVGYGRENIANGYPNPYENQGNQGNGFDPGANGGMGQ